MYLNFNCKNPYRADGTAVYPYCLKMQSSNETDESNIN